MSTAMSSFLAAFDPATRAAAAANSPQSIGAIYSLYDGEIELLFDKEAHRYFVRRSGEEEYKRTVSSTNITGTLDKPALVPWAVKLAAEEILAKVEEHSWLNSVDNVRYVGLVPLEEFTAWVVAAKKEYKAVSQEALDIGHIAHDWLEVIQKAAIVEKTGTFTRPISLIKSLWESGAFELPVVKPDLEGIDEDLQSLRIQVAEIQTAAVQNCCREAVDWMIVHNFRPLKVENKVYSIIHNCAGTFDTIGLFDSCADGECCSIPQPDGTSVQLSVKNLKVLADWKSSKGLWNEYRFQLASYWDFWLEEHKEVLGGRIVVKMPKNVGDKFQAYFLTNEDQPKDFGAFAGLLVPFQRIEEIEEVEWQQNQVRRAKVREEKEQNAAKAEADKAVIRQLRDAERAKKKEDDAAAAVREAEEKAARLAEACPWSKRYTGKNPPKCNFGKGCRTCRETYEQTHPTV